MSDADTSLLPVRRSKGMRDTQGAFRYKLLERIVIGTSSIPSSVGTHWPGTMTGHRLIEPVFEEAGDDPDLLLHHRVGIFDQVRLKTEIVAGQRDERRRVPSVQVHSDLAGAARKHIARKLDEGVRH